MRRWAGVLLVVGLVGACSSDDDVEQGAVPPPFCDELDRYDQAIEELGAPDVFDLDVDEVEGALDRSAAALADLAAATTGEQHDVLSGAVDQTAAHEEELLDAWRTDRDELRTYGDSWRLAVVGPGNGGETPVYEQLVVTCRAPDLEDGPREDPGPTPPGRRIDVFRTSAGGGARVAFPPTGGDEEPSWIRRADWTFLDHVAVAPDGRRVAVTGRHDDEHGLMIVSERRGSRVLDEREERWSCPTWSPDGDRVGVRPPDWTDPFFVVFALDGSEARVRLPFSRMTCVSFVTDHRLLVSGAAPRAGDDLGAFLIDDDGTDRERLPLPTNCNSIVEDVDPRRERAALAVRCDDPLQNGLWIVDLDRLTADHIVTGNVAAPAFSPDGAWIAFGLNLLGHDPGDIGVWLVETGGDGLRELVPSPATFPAWLPAS